MTSRQSAPADPETAGPPAVADRRVIMVVQTMAFALLAQVLAAVFTLGWISAGVITAALLAMIIRHAWREHDTLVWKLVVFGLVVGFGELPADHFGVVVTGTLVYAPGGPRLWVSPLYMPLSWIVVMVQFGVLACRLAPRWGTARTCMTLALLGGLDIPLYELLAKHADLWHYRDTAMVLGVVPYYVIVAEAMLVMVIPLLLRPMADASWRLVLVLGKRPNPGTSPAARRASCASSMRLAVSVRACCAGPAAATLAACWGRGFSVRSALVSG